MSKPETQTDEDAIRRACANFGVAANTGDVDLWVDLYTDDAVVLAPDHAPLKGRAAIRAFLLDQFFTPFNMTMKEQTDDLKVSGDLAYRRGTAWATLTPKSGEPPVEEVFQYLEAWERQPDGSWKVSQDIFNSRPTD